MSRGLSGLQQFILTECGKRGMVFSRDIKARFYDWKTTPVLWKWRYKTTGYCFVRVKAPLSYDALVASPRTLEHAGDLFYRADIGVNEFNAVKVAISKTTARLQRRGLIQIMRFHIEMERLRGDDSYWSN